MQEKTTIRMGAALVALAVSSVASAQSDNRRIQELEDKVELLEKQLNATADAVESAKPEEKRVKIGGYGELHYNNFEEGDDEIDFHRFVLLFGYDFTPSIRFISELELEHALAGDDAPGEIELEQAFIEFDLTDTTRAQGGLFLIPVGILNETHEPTTFYGVERNRVETRIIPTTWWEGGGQLFGQIGETGLSYNIAAHSGLSVEPGGEDAIIIRDGRQKVAEAIANDPAATGRIRYSGIPGLEVAATINYQNDFSQQGSDGLEEAYLYEGHVQWAAGPFGLRALYALWDIKGQAAEALDRDTQYGYYIEPSFKITPGLGAFARYEELEEAEDLTEENITFGANYWPHPQVVLKADYQFRDTEQPDGSTLDGDSLNLGIGYLF